MDDFKQQIQQKLIANIIMDKCKQSDSLIFRDAWCTQDRVIRFTTPFFRELFSVKESESGKWKTGDFVMYEVNNSAGSFVIDCVFSPVFTDYASITMRDRLLAVCGKSNEKASSSVVLKSWDYSSVSDVNKLFEAFDNLITNEIPAYEKKLQEMLSSDDAAPEELHEGTGSLVLLNKYERNQKARAACIAAHGTACAVCGIDFGKAYGPDFAGKIEVHHIVPISEIGEDYVVDPVKDLVQVCPNCHMALHSKKGGVYTVEELIKMRSQV